MKNVNKFVRDIKRTVITTDENIYSELKKLTVNELKHLVTIAEEEVAAVNEKRIKEETKVSDLIKRIDKLEEKVFPITDYLDSLPKEGNIVVGSNGSVGVSGYYFHALEHKLSEQEFKVLGRHSNLVGKHQLAIGREDHFRLLGNTFNYIVDLANKLISDPNYELPRTNDEGDTEIQESPSKGFGPSKLFT